MIPILSKRASGVLLPVFSLPCPWGIGDIGPGAISFIDFLAAAGQSYWQILPLGPTARVFGNSPYMSPSAMAGNPLFISPELLVREGLLRKEELADARFSEYVVDYDRVIPWKQHLLGLAWQRFRTGRDNREQLAGFVDTQPWVREHALFLALKKKFADQGWFRWPRELRQRERTALRHALAELADEVEYGCFEQFLFWRQWQQLLDHARSRGIRLIGDLPIYVAMDSVDVWANQEIFQLSPSGLPKAVAGVPPDYFSRTGQRWGNPLYRWNSRKTGIRERLFAWWEKRLQTIFGQVDLVRIDHFRGFEAYWSIPAREKTAVRGTWVRGPGKTFFRTMEKRLGRLPIIAEDLGIITEKVRRLRDDLGYPGMKILLFAFDGNPDNSYLPHNVEKNSVIYTGTHDNDTAVGWYLSPNVTPQDRRLAKRYANRFDDEASTFHLDMMYLAHCSPSRLSILPLQDVLGFGNDCRINTPGTTSGNWKWRCAQRFLTDEVGTRLRESTQAFGRLGRKTPAKENTTP